MFLSKSLVLRWVSESADFQYKCSDRYHPESERTIRWDDPAIGIEWPLDRVGEVSLSAKDRDGASDLARAETFGGDSWSPVAAGRSRRFLER